MTLLHILVFSLAALLGGMLTPRWRIWFFLICSIFAVFWLQPSTPIRHLDFWFPFAAIALTVFVWAVTHPGQNQGGNIASCLVIVGLVLAIGLSRYLQPLCCLTPTKPPQAIPFLIAVLMSVIAAAVIFRLSEDGHRPITIFIIILLAIFIILKTESLSRASSSFFRTASGQSGELASALDLPWLGFSYLAFRLLHVLIDHKNGRLPPYSLKEFVTFATFFPAYTAGPIDRSQRFMKDLQRSGRDEGEHNRKQPVLRIKLEFNRIALGSWRILWGVFKKFALADSLALIALNSHNAAQVTNPGWMWVLLYAFAFRIYLDFSGYTDIAIGLGCLMGVDLPENFTKPYWQPNLTAFWNSWHITLAQWFRAYFFNPLTRALRSRPQKIPTWMIILIGQFSTMVLIGLWHGVTLNFFLWGAWHGMGLFLHNRWSEWSKSRSMFLENRQTLKQATRYSSLFLTFHFVTLGWVFFALPDTALSLTVLQKLVGL